MKQPILFNTGRPSDARHDLSEIMQKVAHGDKQAFSALYDAVA
ncbi:hypothetical protein ACWGK1_07410 [Streptomyces wedmorensis]